MNTNKPPNIIYGVDDKPPFGACFILACQQLIPPASLTVFAVEAKKQAKGMIPSIYPHALDRVQD